MNEFLLGFDAREGWLSYESIWRNDRKSLYLLREDLVKPLSTDTMVWEPAFDVGSCMGLSYYDPSLAGFEGLEPPSWAGRNHPLWSDLDQLVAHLRREWKHKAKPVRVIAISIVLPTPIVPRGPMEWDIELNTTTPADPDPSWTRLGYDVADNSLLSGLMDCGFGTDEDSDAYKRQWRPKLNDYHLFEDLESAFEFREFSDRRVLEHAPFYVYGLFDIISVGSG